jgi:mRNA interferase MazF
MMSLLCCRKSVTISQLPERGDLVWIDFTPHSGHEQTGHRPALVMSPRLYHERSKLAVVCPITSNTKPWPWKIMLPDGLEASGAISGRSGSLDRPRRPRPASNGRVPQTVVAEVQAKLAALFAIDS